MFMYVYLKYFFQVMAPVMQKAPTPVRKEAVSLTTSCPKQVNFAARSVANSKKNGTADYTVKAEEKALEGRLLKVKEEKAVEGIFKTGQ